MKTLLLVAGLLVPFAEAQVPKKEQVSSLIKLLKNKDAKTRAKAADDLGRVGVVRALDAEDAVKPLTELLRDKDAGVRAAAATALGKIRLEPKTVVPEVAKLLAEKSPTVLVAAANALASYGADAKEALPALQKAQKNAGADKKLRKVLQAAIATIRASS
jgi:HEAT repeat protein